jgi:hypothetical protein
MESVMEKIYTTLHTVSIHICHLFFLTYSDIYLKSIAYCSSSLLACELHRRTKFFFLLSDLSCEPRKVPATYIMYVNICE